MTEKDLFRVLGFFLEYTKMATRRKATAAISGGMA
jgi:hypothetical protein